jgi:hypothetical protein
MLYEIVFNPIFLRLSNINNNFKIKELERQRKKNIQKRELNISNGNTTSELITNII